MGKKGVILDSGKTAQSSMALYWKKNKDSAKHPKQKPQQENEKQITDKSVMSNFQKWKLHKEKLITKAYTKPQQEKQENKKQTTKQKDDQDLMQSLIESKKPKIMTIPGFKSKQQLSKKLQIQKPKEADQSTNILKLPSHMQNMTQQEMINILRQKKSHMMNRFKHQRQENKAQHQNEEQNMLLDDQYIDLTKNKDKKIIENLMEQKIPEEVKVPQPSYFKSDILNQIEKQGLGMVLIDVTKKPQNVETKQLSQNPQNQKEIVKIQHPVSRQNKQRQIIVDKKFLPRALKK